MNLIHIFDDSSRIFNVDSVLFELYSEGNNTARPNSFNKLLQSNVLFTCSADGNFLAPLVTLPEGDTFTFLPKLTSEGFFISTNKYGIVTNDTLIHYIQDLFHPALLRNGVEFPVILLIDGQKLNLPWRIFEICNNLEIVLVSIYPNFSTVITPTDIAVAQKIKKVWKTFLTQTLGDVKNLTVKNFPSTLKSFSGRHFQSQNVKDGFKFTGIFPFSPNSICLKPLLSCTSKPVMIHSKKRVFVHKEDVVYLKDAYGCNE